jgi:hypothetical protein
VLRWSSTSGIEPHVTVFDKSTRHDGTFSRDDPSSVLSCVLRPGPRPAGSRWSRFDINVIAAIEWHGHPSDLYRARLLGDSVYGSAEMTG